MIKYNFLLFIRNIKRDKSSFFINLIGLSTGLACALLIYMWVNDERSMDKFHEKDSRLYQAMVAVPDSEDGDAGSYPHLPGNVADVLINEVPEVEYAADVVQKAFFGKNTLSANDKDIKAVSLYSNKDFFNVFSFNLIAGDKDEVLVDKNSIVLSEALALKLFNTTDNILGKTVKFDQDIVFQVSGIYNNPPKNSSYQFDFVLSTDWIKERYAYMYNWGNQNVFIYAVLQEGAVIEEVNKKIAGILYENNRNYVDASLVLESYSDKYLYADYSGAGGRIVYVRLFSLIAIFILLIACINYMNLSTAQSFRKVKELGIKKAVGASRKMLIMQYLGSSLVFTFISLLIALIIVTLFLPTFNNITGKQIVLEWTSKLCLIVFGITVLTGVLSGSYPALYLSGFNPALVLKGKLTNTFGELWSRKGLVIFQFSLSIILIVGVLIIYKQIQYIQTKNLGYNRENVIYFEREGVAESKLDLLISELENTPGVKYVSSAETSMVADGTYSSGAQWEGQEEWQDRSFVYRNVNYNMLELLDIEMKEGRSFSRGYSNEESKIILNEAAIKYMEMDDPIGKTIQWWGRPREIIGVIRDFQNRSLRETIEPMVFNIAPNWSSFIYAKLESGIEAETINRIQLFYEAYNPGFPLNYKYLDEDYQALYEAENRVAVLSKYFAGIAIIISCLGLFGLSAFTAQRRIKEIGVRKVNGSTALGVVWLLSSDFTKLVFVSIILAFPLSYLIVNSWLSKFAYRIEISPLYFLIAGLITVLISLITVGLHAVKAANLNPALCLKDA